MTETNDPKVLLHTQPMQVTSAPPFVGGSHWHVPNITPVDAPAEAPAADVPPVDAAPVDAPAEAPKPAKSAKKPAAE